MKRIFTLFLLLASIVQAKEIDFGVFAYLGYEKTKQKYQPLVNYLNETLEEKVILHVLTHQQMVAAAQKKQIDIATTNATNYFLFRNKYNLTGALATLVTKDKEKPIKHLAGVMAVKKNSGIEDVEDFKNKVISTAATTRMGGFRAQAYELYKQDIDIFKYAKKIIQSGGDHHQSVRNVLKAKADVAFVRDGIIEDMIENKEVGKDELRIINATNYPNHPYLVSTSLYHEWPVFAMPYADEQSVKKFVAAIFNFDIHSTCFDSSEIYGYTLPADYAKIEQLNRTLRLPPFDKAPTITYKDIWEQHYEAILVFVFAFLIIVVLYIAANRRKNMIQSLLSNMGEGVYGVDGAGECIWINQKALELLGLSEKEALHKNQHLLFHYKKPDNSPYEEKDCPIYKTIDDKKTRVVQEHFVRKDGSMFPIQLTVSATKDLGAIVIFRDITKQVAQDKRLKEFNVRLQYEVQQQVEQIREKDRLLQEQSKFALMGEMVSAIAHHWRQPLNALSINIQNLDDDYEEGLIDAGFIDRFIDKQSKMINSMSQTIEDFRNFFTKQSEEKTVALKPLFAKLHKLLASQLQSLGIECELRGEDFSVFACEDDLGQVFLNLLNNSKDAIIEKRVEGGCITIILDAKSKSVTIKDNGLGVDQERLDRIYEPYFTTKEQGTGIGLYMSKVMLKNQGADIFSYNGAQGLVTKIEFKERR